MQPGQAFERLVPAPAYRLVFDTIEKGISQGSLRPGDMLPTETELARQFGVNRSTVREGIRLLEESGLVQRENGKRLRVTLPHFGELASRASRALVMHQVTFRELWEASVAIEPLVAAAAAVRIKPEDLGELADNIEAMRLAIGDVDQFIRLDVAFHDIITRASGNRVLSLAREPISLLFLPAGRVILPRLRTHQRVIDAHQFILDALRTGDAAKAKDWMTRHMEDFHRAYLRTGLAMDAPLESQSLSG